MKKQKWGIVVSVQFCWLLCLGGVKAQAGLIPVPIRPMQGMLVSGPGDAGGAFMSSWRKVNNATSYRLAFYRNNTLEHEVVATDTTARVEGAYFLNSPLEAGIQLSMSWRLKAVFGTVEGEWSEFFNFIYFYPVSNEQEEVPSVFQTLVYPNPVSEIFTVSADTPLEGYEVKLFDILGRAHKLQIIAENEHEIQLKRTLNLPNGVYFLWFKVADKQFFQKIIVKE